VEIRVSVPFGEAETGKITVEKTRTRHETKTKKRGNWVDIFPCPSLFLCIDYPKVASKSDWCPGISSEILKEISRTDCKNSIVWIAEINICTAPQSPGGIN
jgi:hypothetical protein